MRADHAPGQSNGRPFVASFYRQHGKRLFDLVLAALTLVALSPVLLLVALSVRFKIGSPVLFCHARTGLQGKLFNLTKFRSMNEAVDDRGELLPDEQRLTAFGKLLRAWSLDELPELWNILRGEMSFVGPRPLLVEYLELYSPDQMRRHELLPGLTGWSQIHGRNALSWEEKFSHDVWYVDHCSFALDLQILFKTIGKVLTRQGVSQNGHATMEKFKGTKEQAVKEHLDKGVIVLGAGGHAKVVVSTLLAAGYEISGIYDDAPELLGKNIQGIEVRGSISGLPTHSTTRAIVAIGDSLTRQAIVEQFSFTWITLVHPTAYVDAAASIGAGSVIMAGAIIQPDSHIGRHAIVNTAASIDHDCLVGDFVHIGPGCHLAGAIHIGQRTLLGTGSIVVPRIQIGADVVVGAGTVIIKDVPENVTAVGHPARIIKQGAQHTQAA